MKLLLGIILLSVQLDCFAQQILMPYRKGNLWGYADTTGKIVVTPQFDETRLFFDDVAYTNVIKVLDNKVMMGVIKNTGQIIIPPANFRSYDLASRNFDFYGGPRTYLPKKLNWDETRYGNRNAKTWKDSLPVYFFAKRGRDYGLDSIYVFDSTGKQLNQTPVHEIGLFSYIPQTYHFLVKVNGKMGVMNQQGTMVIPIIYDKLECILYENGQYSIIAQKGGKYGLIDMQHKIVLPIVHSELHKEEYGYEKDFLIIARKDKQETALLPNGITVQQYVNGRINVNTDYEKRRAYKLQIDKDYYKNGMSENRYETVEAKADSEMPPSPKVYYDDPVKAVPYNADDNVILVFTENNKKGVKQNEKVLIAPEYDSLFLVSIQSNQQYYIAKRKNKFGIISTNGTSFIPLTYNSLSLLYNPYTSTEKYFLVQNKKNKYGILTIENKETVPAQFQQIELRQFETGNDKYITVFHCTDKNGTSLYRLDGSIYMKTSYTKMIPINTSSTNSIKQIKWLVENEQQQKGIIDSTNNIIIPVQYNEITGFYVEHKGKNQYYFKVKNESNKKGLIDINGQEALPAVYDSLYNIADASYNYGNQQSEPILGVRQNNLHGIVNMRNELKLPIAFTSAPRFFYRQLPYIIVEKFDAIGIATFENPYLIPPDSTISFKTDNQDYNKAYQGILFYKDKNKKENNLGVFIIKDHKVIRKLPAVYHYDWGGSSSNVNRRYFQFLALSRKGETKIPFDYVGYNGVLFFED